MDTYTWLDVEKTMLMRRDGSGNTSFIPPDPENSEYAAFLASGQIASEVLAVPDYIGFSNALMASTAYGVIRTAAKTSLTVNVVATELLSLLGDAKLGRALGTAIQSSLAELDTEVPLSQDDRDELNALFSAFSLPYSL